MSEMGQFLFFVTKFGHAWDAPDGLSDECPALCLFANQPFVQKCVPGAGSEVGFKAPRT